MICKSCRLRNPGLAETFGRHRDPKIPTAAEALRFKLRSYVFHSGDVGLAPAVPSDGPDGPVGRMC